MCFATASSQAQADKNRWQLRILNLQHQVKVEATIRFVPQTATESCMGGEWKRVVVDAATARDERFFPLGERLAYEIRGNEITLGRTAVCDGYLFLSGKWPGSSTKGTYNAIGMGTRKPLGYFTLKKI